MKLGQRMVRLEDGQKGVVAQSGPELRILYVDRGEERLASKTEKWAPDEIIPGPLRLEEQWLIARYADRALQAHERHEPLRFWQLPKAADAVYDEGLVMAILKYLGERAARAAPDE